jgi:dolichol-phosphate mannosyltransferase
VKCYVILPCYNEEQNLKTLIPAISATIKPKMPYTIIAINDGSTDHTTQLLNTLSKQYPLQIIQHIKNKGLAETLKDGLNAAAKISKDEDLIITMDADNTHDPRYMLDMTKVAAEADIVIASRYVKGGKQLNVPPHRILLSKAINQSIKLATRIPIKDATSGYRCIKAKTIKNLHKKLGKKFIESKGFEITLEILLKLSWLNPKMLETPITLDYSKKGGHSKMKLLPTIKRYLALLLNIKKQKKQLKKPT